MAETVEYPASLSPDQAEKVQELFGTVLKEFVEGGGPELMVMTEEELDSQVFGALEAA